jgi:hypothetical protein
MIVIRYFTEKSANEHTYLAWVRTGIAVIAFLRWMADSASPAH